VPNRLAAERSPYLLQHAENPVDWFPWAPAAFEKSRAEHRPIFLSIGYSTCHWCHVMAHESFEDPAIARLLNENYVSIKVDREERPDVDRVYMSFVQATTGSGGWPMSVWLTPDLKPFFGGTYFPPRSRWGRPGFAEVLEEVARVWKEDPVRVTQSAETLLERLRAATSPVAVAGARHADIADPATLGEGVKTFRDAFDRTYGGFGSAPKFPRPSELLFLLREYARTGDGGAREMVDGTLRAMALGGMRDHIGGGFHRYSVDAEWRIPHFEKMLYDQAQLALAYLEAAQATDDPFHEDVAADTLDYVLRDLADADGGFYSAEDADSVPPEQAAADKPHKSEGAFYLWPAAEIDRLLGGDAEAVKLRFGVEPQGNALQDPQGEFTGKNVLFVRHTVDEVARLTGQSAAEVAATLDRARDVLFRHRADRPKPHLDDKILAGWNGLTIAALARAGRTMRDAGRADRYRTAAGRAAVFIHDRMWSAREGLLRRYRRGEAAIAAYGEDYAAIIWGALELFQATGESRWLSWALELQKQQDDLFWDSADGGWFSTSGRDPAILMRLKDDYDGAEPSASSLSILNAFVMGHLTGDRSAMEKAERSLARFGPTLGRLARAVPLTAAALSAYHAGVQQVVIAGPRESPGTRALFDVLARTYLPFAVVIPIDPGPSQRELADVLPVAGSMPMRDGRSTAYVCRDFTCAEPATDPVTLRRQLSGPPA
jgi:uncharacterized protein YyaL (SSP411 family)